ncbi:lipoyl(octanoyl) transferase LipB [Agrococcus casei]|uniref:Octanoyltransferase n=1 Tax=Agrococcus casei LMG 22410 TaxID=1255656 RepID=A0A1R4GEI0_9MICO|nr:lipoyl(octanoyl) transferase LipB [Agrococcus casei]SJM66591.1 Octanoate-[acyl-carrier-protein]-protein-N-octan oyltransferase [Agrococcus casei LMG 22410]
MQETLEEAAAKPRSMKTRWLGAEVDYQWAWDLQRRLHESVCGGGESETLLLEHASVFTAGSRTEQHELPVDQTPVVWVDRGGKITWHGPGQAVVYPIVALPDAVRVVDWVRRLEEAILRALAEWGIRARRIADRAGVWLDDAAGPRKIAQIGVRVSQRVSMHGVAINVSCGMQGFDQIVPCGITDAGVTSMQTELAGRGAAAPHVREVAEAFARHLQELLDFEPFDTIAETNKEEQR